MPSQWETLSIPFVGGVDTKTDGKLLPPPKLTILENGIFAKHGTVRHRYGYDVTAPRTLAAVDIENAVGLATRNDELLLAANSRLYSYDTATDAYVDVGPMQYLTSTSEAVASTNSAQEFAEVCTQGGVTVAAWQDSRDGLRVSAYNETTGAPYATDLLIDADGRAPQMVVVSGGIMLVWYNASSFDIMGLRINPASVPESLAAQVITLRANASATLAAFDVSVWGDLVVLLYATDMVAEETHLALIDPSGVAVSSVPASVTGKTVHALGLAVADNHVYTVVAVEGIASDKSDIYLGTFAKTSLGSGSSVLQEHGQDRIRRMAIAPQGSSAIYYWESEAAEDYNHTVSRRQLSGTASVTRHSKLASRAFTVGSSTYVHLLHESALQSTYFLVRDDGHLCGRYYGGLASDASGLPKVPSVQAMGSGRYGVALRTKRRLDIAQTAAGADRYTHDNFKRTVHTFDSPDQFHAVQSGGAAYIAGGLLWQYDGGAPVESGFLLYPENGDYDLVPTGASLPAGTYNYRVYYEWTNGAGERERSSAIAFQVVSAGPNKVKLTIPTLAHTLKLGSRPNVALVVYRTESLGSSFYRCSSPDPTSSGDNAWVENDPTVDSIEFIDDMLDATLRTKEPDYQNTGELDNVAPESGSVIAATISRLFLAGGTIPDNTVYVSKQRGLGQPAGEFNGNLVIRVPDEGGPVTAFGEINGTLVIFKRDRIYTMDSAGPNDLGGGNGFQLPQMVASDVGCSKPRTVALTPMGLVFVSQRGVYLLNPSQGAQYIGAEVEGLNAQNYVSAQAIPDQSVVVFLTDDGKTVVYDYMFNQWSTWTNHAGIDSKLWGTTYCYLRSDGHLCRQNISAHTDGGVPFPLHFRTAPIRPPGIGVQEHWRLRRASVLGEYYSPHSLVMSLFYNRDDNATEVVRFEPDEILNLRTWGEDGRTWGEDGYVWGGTGTREYQFELRCKRQKCETVAFDFYDIPGTPHGAAYELTELALEWAPKTGLTKQSADRKV